MVLEGGRPALAIEGQGRDLRPLCDKAEDALQLLPHLLDAPARVRRLRKLEVETWDGGPANSSTIRERLQDLGFDADPQRMTLRPSRL